MKWLCLTILAAAAGLLAWPLLNENTGSTCSAWEDLMARQVTYQISADQTMSREERMWTNLLANGVTALSRGRIAATKVKQTYPNLPPFLGCAILYYQHTLDPSLTYTLLHPPAPVTITEADTPASPTVFIPAYTPPPTPAPAHPHAGAATPLLCVYWLRNNRSALNDPAGPGGRDPVIRVTGPSATAGSFGADNTACRLTLTHASGMREIGWLTLRPALRWMPEN